MWFVNDRDKKLRYTKNSFPWLYSDFMFSKNIHLVGTRLKEGITQLLLYFRKSSRKSRKSKSKVVFFKVLPVSSTLYQVLFTWKKWGAFDDVCVCCSSKIGFFSYKRAGFTAIVKIHIKKIRHHANFDLVYQTNQTRDKYK